MRRLSAFAAVVFGLALVLSAPPASAQTTTIALSFTDTSDGALTAVGEDDGAQTVRVVATASSAVGSSVSVSVTVGASGGTATAGSCTGSGCTGDYEASAASVTVTIASGDTSGSADVTVTPFADTVTEDHETVRFTGTASGYTVTQADLAITDADRIITLTWDDAVFSESEGYTSSNIYGAGSNPGRQLTGTLSGATSTYSGNINERLRMESGTARHGSQGHDVQWAHEPHWVLALDLSRRRFLNIPSGSVSATVGGLTVYILNDRVAEPDQTFFITMNTPPGFTLVRAQGVIKDLDSSVFLTPAPAGLGEGGVGSSVSVSAAFRSPGGTPATSSEHSTDTVVALSVSGGTAGSSDFSYDPPAPNTVTIPARAVSSAVAGSLTGLRVADDRLREGPETLNLGGDLGGFDYRGSLGIIDDDARIGLSLTDATGGPLTRVGEGTSTTVRVRASLPVGIASTRATTAPITVRVRVDGLHPISDEDHAPVAPFDITIPAGARSATGSFAFNASGAYDDTVFEYGGWMAVTGTASGFFAVAPASLWLYDNDPDPDPADSGGPSRPEGCEGRFCDDDLSMHQTAIERIAGWGIATGCDPGNPYMFCPNRQITRAQMAEFLYRAAARAAGADPAAGETELSDVPAGSPHRAYAQWAVSTGAFAAPEGRFGPGLPVTRADIAVIMLAVFTHLGPGIAPPQQTFADMGATSTLTQINAEALYRAGVTRGCATSPLRYCPDRPVTRAQAAAFIARALNTDPAATTP